MFVIVVEVLLLSVSDEGISRYGPGGFVTSIMLWDQTRQLPKEQLKKVEDVYRDNFPLEVREGEDFRASLFMYKYFIVGSVAYLIKTAFLQ